MGEKIVVGPIGHGLKKDVLAFNIDNDSFPTLINAYQWRSRVRRKRGTELLSRLTRYFDSLSTAFNPGTTTQVLSGGGAGNLLTGFASSGIQSTASVVPGTVTINDQTTSVTYTDPAMDGTLSASVIITGATQANPCVLTANNSFTGVTQVSISQVGGMTQLNGNTYTVVSRNATTITISVDSTGFGAYTSGGLATATNQGTINYATGAFVISPAAADTVNAHFNYYPALPVLGEEDLVLSSNQFPGTLAFDSVYSYNLNTSYPYANFNVSFYKNPATGAYSGYTQKSVWTPTSWNGEDYQQFWSTNYQGAFWVTNGIRVPFDSAKVGMQFKRLTSATVVGASTTDVDFVTTTNHPFVVGDFVFINEVTGINGLNFLTGYVLSAPAPGATTFRARFPNANIAGGPGAGGIAQALTTRCDPDISSVVPTTTKDCLRWYDGAPVDGAIPPVFTAGSGWVNFAPPLLSASTGTFSISDLPPGQWYLVGARMVVPFKDRILFFGPVVQTSSSSSQQYLQDTVIYSQNGTAFYTCSFPYTGTPVPSPSIIPTTTFTPILVPTNQTATPSAYWEDVTGYGGFVQAGIDQPITSVSSNEDVLLVGFATKQTRFVYTGNDLIPFLFYIVNSELGSSSTFSSVTLDRGALTVGSNGIILTSQTGAQRIDLDIPDEVFQFNYLNNGIQRVCSQRDFINEWIYFTYSPANANDYFPAQTLLYNYRENTWAMFKESYTTYGSFRKSTGQVWDDLTDLTWDEWTDPWDSGEQTLLQPEVIAGNQQGFILVRAEGTGEDPSGYIQAIDANSVVTSPHHNLNDGDYIVISDALGTIGPNINNRVFSVSNPTTNTFTLNPTVVTGTYLGAGVFTRLYVPFVQTKQFPVSWGMMRKTRLGPQMYLFTATTHGQITLRIYLSQDATNPYNAGPIVPSASSVNNSLVYSDSISTAPEPNNLQTPFATNQAQIWHRMNTSLLGDTVQLGITLSDTQMRSYDVSGTAASITGATKANPCVLTCTGQFSIGTLVSISSVTGMSQLNGNIYYVTESNSTTVAINVDSSLFGTYVSGGTATPVTPQQQTEEIELHGFVLDVSPSQLLA